MPPKQRPDSKEACYAPPALPREKYIAEDYRRLPPLPERCPRCQAAVVPCDIELESQYVPGVRCPICGFQADRYMLSNIGKRLKPGHKG